MASSETEGTTEIFTSFHLKTVPEPNKGNRFIFQYDSFYCLHHNRIYKPRLQVRCIMPNATNICDFCLQYK